MKNFFQTFHRKCCSLFVLACLFFQPGFAQADNEIVLSSAKFNIGDTIAWKDLAFNDYTWKTVKPDRVWEDQGYKEHNGYAWYRFHFNLPKSLKNKSFLKDSLIFYLGKIDDVDEVYLNGLQIGSSGRFPNHPKGYQSAYDLQRIYKVSSSSPALRWNEENVLAVRVFDLAGSGGIFYKMPFISMLDLIHSIEITSQKQDNKQEYSIQIKNRLEQKANGTLAIQIKDFQSGSIIQDTKTKIQIDPLNSFNKILTIPSHERYEVSAVFEEKLSKKSTAINFVNHYILTPPIASSPQINGPKIVGLRPGSPITYKIPVSGKKPLTYKITNLPQGLQMDNNSGIIRGIITDTGVYKMQVHVSNSFGTDDREFTIKVGNLLALTPPMGWNSWNCWGLSVSQEKVKASAQAIIDKGLIDHGWSYINIDDGWEHSERARDGTILANQKFPDMKGLGNWLHERGLKFGIYSSPGNLTCGGYLGSHQHEMQDAKTYADWGIDYLKYDWCSYGKVFQKEGDTSLAAYMKPYKIMQAALSVQPRDIYYSLCQYGMKEVWKWGHLVNGNSWRTTGDIADNWISLSTIGFNQDNMAKYVRPGRWNDPDMLIVGNVGWGENLHTTQLTPDEQYTHISLWSMLSAPLLLGCDISRMDDFTLNLVTNDEVIAINQDLLGKQARLVLKKDNYQVWIKELENGEKAIGIFNLLEKSQTISLNLKDLGASQGSSIRDLWRQKSVLLSSDTYVAKIAAHGVVLIKVK